MDTWECGCGRSNPAKTARCILCRTPRGKASSDLPQAAENPMRYFGAGHAALLERLEAEGVPVAEPIQVHGVSRMSLAEIDALLAEMEQDYRELAQEEA